MDCKVVLSSRLIGRKWSIPIIEEIALKKFCGFNQFSKKAGITPRTLSQQLKGLEESGLIRKYAKNWQTNYRLTRKGKELHGVITEIKEWSIRWNKSSSHCLDVACTECCSIKKP